MIGLYWSNVFHPITVNATLNADKKRVDKSLLCLKLHLRLSPTIPPPIRLRLCVAFASLRYPRSTMHEDLARTEHTRAHDARRVAKL